ncbi:putative ferric-chelate reductase 1 [Xenopus tropicalis]|uniref:Ferric-chelate reductase 1 n=1 Tax=Xenopus tropicalis TaxID=8364 RepID=A0A8J1JGM5_XENTR|nr:putative ferric-chelate reductase 1 [Xenopus tropicalis]
MFPLHDALPQNSNPPYILVSSKDTYSNGEKITVSLTTTDTALIKGFMIQARKANGDILVGSFEVSNADAQTLTCKSPADAVSHTDSNLKSNIQVTWTAPDVLTGNVMFRATVVKSKKTFWTNVVSTALIYNNKVSNTTTTALNGHTVTALNGHTATTSHGSSNSGFRLSASFTFGLMLGVLTVIAFLLGI